MLVGYLDANSGSLLVSAVAAGSAGVAVAVKFGLRRLGVTRRQAAPPPHPDADRAQGPETAA